MKYRVWFCFWLLLAASGSALAAPAVAPKVTIDAWVGKELVYDIAFLWFDRIAEGQLAVSPGSRPGTYRALLEARTLGVTAWVTSDRVQRYESLMETSPDGHLRSLSYESRIIKGPEGKRKDRGKRYLFDHGKGQVSYARTRDGVPGAATVLPIQGTPPADILTAFFNFQAGVYGPLTPGETYRILALAKKGVGWIDAEVLPGEKWPAKEFFSKNGTLVKVRVDPEVFETKDGILYIWFDQALRPERGIVENVIGLGSIYGSERPLPAPTTNNP